MNITANAASLNWKTNNKGVWKALVKDMAPDSSVTFSDGLTGTVAGRQVTVESPSMPTGFMTYTTDDNAAVFGSVLYGAGTVSDSLEAVSGGKTVRMGSVDLGTLDWLYKEDNTRFYAAMPSNAYHAVSGWYSIGICSNGYLGKHAVIDDKSFSIYHNGYLYIKDTLYTDPVEFKTAMSGVILHYRLAEPMTSTETAQSLSLQTGVNNLALNERDSSFTLDYTGTEFTLPLDSTRKYAFSDNGVKSMLTGSTEQAVTGGQDMLVDVTRMFNGDATAISAITSWEDMAAVMPEYLSNVAYNEGEVVGRSGGVTTAKWNQLVQNGNFADGTTGWSSSSDGALSTVNNALTFTKNSSTNIWTNLYCQVSLLPNHTYAILVYLTATASYTTQLSCKSWQGVALSNGISVAISANIRTKCFGIVTTLDKAGDARDRITIQATPQNALTTGDTIKLENVQLFDLTEIYGAGHEPSTAEEFEADRAKWGKDLTQYQPYDVGTPMGGSATFSALHGVGTAKDTQDVVTGAKTVKMGSVDLGTLNWTFSTAAGTSAGGYWRYQDLTNLKPSPSSSSPGNFVSDKYITTASAYVVGGTLNSIGVNNHSPNGYLYVYNGSSTEPPSGMFYYETVEPTSSTETAQPLTAVQGLNNVHEQNMSITGTPITMGYTGTDQTLSAETSSKYLARIDGVDSVVENVESVDVTGGRDRVIDLTYMFGEGSEPATAADFYKLFPTWLGYAIPYNKGSLVNFKGTGLKSVGFNLLDLTNRTLGQPQYTSSVTSTVRGVFDETKYYKGFTYNNGYAYNNVTEWSVSANSVTVKASQGGYGLAFPIRCVPGRVYRIENFAARHQYLLFYTYNGTFITSTESQYYTAPYRAYWCLILFRPHPTPTVLTTWTNPCVHLQWSGGRNGQYEPYWDYTRQLPTLTYFEQGMNGRSGVFDEVTQRQAVTRLAEVDMEDLEWTESNGSWTATLSGMKANTTSIVAENGLKPIVSGTTVTIQSTESPTGKLVYELANPSVVTFPEEVNTTAQVSDYGTESVVPANGYELVTAPFLGIVKYQDNYARTITKLPENYQSQNSMDALQLVLGQLLNVTLTSRFDAEEQAYGYTVTGDGVPGLIAAALTALAPVTGLTFLGNSYTPTAGIVSLPDPTVQSITTIPASTSSYTLGEGVYSHAPNSVPTYTLPDVEDATVVHTAKLTVKMSASILTANFRNSAGDVVSYEAPTGTISSGTLVEYVCTYEPLANGWSIAARVVMQTA